MDIADVSSERRNPILANVMAQLDYMEKRGSGLLRIRKETMALDGYRDELQPIFKSTSTQFQTTIFATTDTSNVGDLSEIKLTDRQRKMLNLIKESPTITGRQMSERLSVSQRTIERDLSGWNARRKRMQYSNLQKEKNRLNMENNTLRQDYTELHERFEKAQRELCRIRDNQKTIRKIKVNTDF